MLYYLYYMQLLPAHLPQKLTFIKEHILRHNPSDNFDIIKTITA